MTVKLGLLNTTIATTDGEYYIKTIAPDVAFDLVHRYGRENLISAIGHESTAQIMSQLLGYDIPVNRQNFHQQVGQQCLVFKLNGRTPEGQYLSIADIQTIGYCWKLMTRTR